MDEIEKLEEQISELPQGYVTRKVINGKEYFYLQWRTPEKNESQILKENEVDFVKAQIEKRKELVKQLKLLKKKSAKSAGRTNGESSEQFLSQVKASITYGEGLRTFIETAANFKKRDCIVRLDNYINSSITDKVCVVYGLRRTGKTTMLKQELLSFDEKRLKASIYIKVSQADTIASINQDLKLIEKAGFKYIFIDEVTLIEDFIDSASLFSDVFAARGLKIVLSGTDSLGFYFAEGEELYDRAEMIHTTFIPYHEHARLLGITDIDEYIRYGGTLKAGELNFEDKEVNTEEASFRDDETARRYIDTAICKNIQHSLKCYRDGKYFRHLKELYDKNELTNAINRIIETENHDFTVSVVTQLFKSHDLRSTAQMLRTARDESRRTDVLDQIDSTQILSTLKSILEIKEKEEQQIGIEAVHVSEIKQYLKQLDLIDTLEIDTLEGKRLEYTIFTQPGMRFCQAQALVYSVMKDPQIQKLDKQIITLISNKIIEGVLGHMLEDIVIYETKRKLMPKRNGNKKEVIQIRFATSEFDMVIYNSETNSCEAYEVKHSSIREQGQYKHLINEDFINAAEKKFGKITKRCVLYKGETFIEENGIEYKNVEEYLCELSR